LCLPGEVFERAFERVVVSPVASGDRDRRLDASAGESGARRSAKLADLDADEAAAAAGEREDRIDIGAPRRRLADGDSREEARPSRSAVPPPRQGESQRRVRLSTLVVKPR
jgi:hypothetical protein